MRPLHWFAACLVAATFTVSAEAPFSFDSTPGKLPKTVVPESYTARFVPNVHDGTFLGYETIVIRVRQPTTQIVLNQLNIEVKSAVLDGKGVAKIKLAPKIDNDQQTMSFDIPKPLEPGQYRLVIDYRGRINHEPQGLYLDKYPTPSGEKTSLETHMEATDARRLLPCWDEPSFRAHFQFALDLPAGYRAFSNMPLLNQERIAGGLQRFSFGRTPKMASYLVVLVAGQMERIEGVQDGVNVGVVTTNGKLASGSYALTSAKDILHFYDDYFGVRFPLPKLDLIAVPGGIPGAMENWGGIVFNEAYLLYNPQESSEKNKEVAFAVIAHEMAHQWFGDLVTMAWWDNLWLNEGFASWMGTKATDHFNPDWDVWLQSSAERERAMNLDARQTTHPIQQTISNESQARDAFDEITYLKGQSFLRMLEAFLGPDVFRQGIRAYVAAHQYSNTTTADLWAALEQASGKPVAKIASDWTGQPGFPEVKVDAVCDNGQHRITLTQAQFQVDSDQRSDRLWSIPVAIGTVGGTTEYTLLQARSATVNMSGCDRVIIVDPEALGYYRVEYAPDLYAALSKELTQLSPPSRLKLLADSWAMTAVNRLPLAAYLGLVSTLGDEPKMAVWEEVISRLETLDSLLQGEALRPHFRRYAIALLAPKLKDLGTDPKPSDSAQILQLRADLFDALGSFGDESIIAEAKAQFRSFVADPASLPVSLADPVTHTVGRYADAETYQLLAALGAKALTTEEKLRYYTALESALEPTLADKTLALTLSDEPLPPNVSLRILPHVAGDGEHLAQTWAFAKLHGDVLAKKVGSRYINRLFPDVVSSSADPAIADDLEAYVKANLPPDSLTRAHRTADAIRFRAKLKARLLPQLSGILKDTAAAP